MIEMSIGQARAIFNNIDSQEYCIAEKKRAIEIVLDMETHNSVTKMQMLKVMRFMSDTMSEMETIISERMVEK